MSALLLLAGATGEPPAPVWRVDLPLALVAQPPASGVETRVVPWFGARVARLLEAPADQLVVFGGDAAGMLGFGPNEGTSKVSASRLSAALELRGLAAINAFHTATTWVRPYGYGALLGGAAISTLSAYADQSLHLLPAWGLGAGAGLELTVHVVALRVELGAGVRDGAFALESRLAAGAAF